VGDALAGAVVAVQIPYPIVPAGARTVLTLVSVPVFAAACTAHAAAARGPRWAASYLAVATGVGLAAEAVGVRTGWPFGAYSYTGGLGATVVGVPVVVPLAWAMMAYPALVFARRAAGAPPQTPAAPRRVSPARRRAGAGRVALAGGLLLTGWDLFLDPQMVAEGHWAWTQPGPALNGVPLTNAAGWLAVGTVLTGLLAALPAGAPEDGGSAARPKRPRRSPDDRLPFVLLGWVYLSSVLANLAFFGRPAVALAGGLGMGAALAAGLPRASPRRRPGTAAAICSHGS
jgi:putative membrane protein